MMSARFRLIHFSMTATSWGKSEWEGPREEFSVNNSELEAALNYSRGCGKVLKANHKWPIGVTFGRETLYSRSSCETWLRRKNRLSWAIKAAKTKAEWLAAVKVTHGLSRTWLPEGISVWIEDHYSGDTYCIEGGGKYFKTISRERDGDRVEFIHTDRFGWKLFDDLNFDVDAALSARLDAAFAAGCRIGNTHPWLSNRFKLRKVSPIFRQITGSR